MPACLYINLDAADARRRSLEASFAAAEANGWRLERFAALGPGYKGMAGKIAPGAQGCFHSHREALASRLAGDEPVMIVEDDALFARDAFAGAERLLAQPGDWDILLLEAAILEPPVMVNLARARDALAPRGEVGATDLRKLQFAGAVGYVVRGAAKEKVHAALAQADLSRPYDLYLRDLCQAGRLNIAVAIPFLVTLSPEGDASQIRKENPVWDRPVFLFRRYMFQDRDLPALIPEAEVVFAAADPEGRVLGAALAAVTSPSRRAWRR